MWQDVSPFDEELELKTLTMNTGFYDNNISIDISREIIGIVIKMAKQNQGKMCHLK